MGRPLGGLQKFGKEKKPKAVSGEARFEPEASIVPASNQRLPWANRQLSARPIRLFG
jgi:hypothetical protein